MDDFRKYATKHLGINSMVLDGVIQSQANYLNPYILEERQLNVTQLDVFFNETIEHKHNRRSKCSLLTDDVSFLKSDLSFVSFQVLQPFLGKISKTACS